MVNFEEVKRGYNKEQVDNYIKIINGEYEKLLVEYQELKGKSKEDPKDISYNDAIASALINAEISGKQVVAKAQLEAKRITTEANIEANKINEKKQKVLEEVAKLSKMLIALLDSNVHVEEKEEDKKEDI
jgi:Cell division initiation protein